jgi:penicillin G amidase
VIRFLFRLLLGRRLPVTEGSLRVPGLAGKLTIRRDRHGIPLIEAQHQRDCSYAIGFCHGQDRAFQLEILHRVARGTVAALIGPAALPVDRLSRRIGFFRSAREQLTLIDADLRDDLEAYAAGVNAARSAVPHEMALLGGTMLPWEPADSLAIAKVMSFKLASNWDAELMRLKVLTTDGPEALAALDPTYAAWQPVIQPPGEPAGRAVDRLAEDVAYFLKWAGGGSGSNNWAVAPSRTTTGRPILANDPHLDAGLPSHWYLIAARGPEHAVAGATLLGGPAVLAGHNGHIAWGLTAGLVDNTDLFLEELEPDARSVRFDGMPQACEVREEVIEVKGGKPITERVLITPRGPIIGPTLVDTPQAISLCATWLRPAKVRGLFTVYKARDFAAFREECRFWPVSSQCLAYADAAGAIGWQLAGDAPRRKKGHGLLPMPGWDSGCGWYDLRVPFDDQPHGLSPACGWVATANNRLTPEGVGAYLGSDFLDGYRAEAIGAALEARHDWDVPTTMRLLTDQRAPAWGELREFVLALDEVPGELRDWDGVVSAESRGATLYELWVSSMVRRVARAIAPRSWEWVVGKGLAAITPYNFGCFRRTAHLVRLLREDTARWRGEMQAALREAEVDSLDLKPGEARPWGEMRKLIMHHPLSRAPGWLGWAMSRVFNLGPVPCGGDSDVINQASVLPLEPLAPADNIASLRMVIDVGAWHNSRWVLPGGQSGNPLSPHYADQFALWQRGDGVAIAFTAGEMRTAGKATLELSPA